MKINHEFEAFAAAHPAEAESLITAAAKYSPEGFSLFAADCGWMPWMEDYTEAEDGEPCADDEAQEINKILFGAFERALALPCLEDLTFRAGYVCGYDSYISSGDLVRGCSSAGRNFWSIPDFGLIFDDGEFVSWP